MLRVNRKNFELFPTNENTYTTEAQELSRQITYHCHTLIIDTLKLKSV